MVLRKSLHWRFPALLLPVFFVSALAGAPATGPIPGVDEIPRPTPAPGDPPIRKENYSGDGPKKEEVKKEEPKKGETKKEEPTKGEPKKEEPVKEEPKKEEPKKEEESLPTIRKLRVQPHATKKYSVVLTWEVAPGNTAPIYVGRYREEVKTPAHVLDTDNLTAPALGPKETTFTDSKMPDGTYFYVVVTGDEIKPNATLILKPDENTTTQAVVIKRSRKEGPKLDEGPPAVRNLIARPHPDVKGAAVLTWDIVGKASDTIILRHRRPISDEASFRAAKRVAALRSWARHYIDREVPAGTYYYAAYLQRETRGDLTLKESQNYTNEPYISDYVPPKTEPSTKTTAADFQVRGLTAVNTQASVKLSWRAARATPVVYKVYRSAQPLDGEKALGRAKLLGETEDRLNFEDTSPLEDQRVYYGVTVTDPRAGREYAGLSEGVSFRSHVYQPRAVPKKLEHLLPDALTTFLKDAKSVMLFWAEPDSKVEGYRVYRHNRPIDSQIRLKDSTLIGRIDGTANRFEDSNPPPGQHYYALLPLDERGTEIREFVERRTFTGFGIEIDEPVEPKKEEPKKEEPKKEEKKEEPKKEEPKKEEPKKEEPQPEPRLLVMRAAVDDRDIVVSWEAELPPGAKVTIRLYRSGEPLQMLRHLEERGVFLEEKDPAEGVYRDSSLEPGRYYYAAVLVVDGKLQRRMQLGRNFLAQGLVIREPESKKSAQPEVKEAPVKTEQIPPELELLERLDAVLRDTFGRKRYSAAVRELHHFATNRRYPSRVRGKALFYSGLAYYRMGRYKDAVEYFLNFRVQVEYPQRSKFYYHRALERLR